jgi:hypothetical protein
MFILEVNKQTGATHHSLIFSPPTSQLPPQQLTPNQWDGLGLCRTKAPPLGLALKMFLEFKTMLGSD